MGLHESRLQELWDHHEIRQLLATYCHGCDRGDTETMASVYCEHSWDDHGPNKCDGKTFAQLILKQAEQTTRLVSHQLGQSLIKVDHNTAQAETYFVATLVAPADAGERMTQLGGRYMDRLERENSLWKIKERLCIRDWSSSGLIDPGYLQNAGFIEGQRGSQDVAWSPFQ